MCLTFLLVKQLPELPMVLLFNRDEDYSRPTAPAHFWDAGQKPILGGRDALKGGTWAGVNRRGEFGLLTFVREARQKREPKYGRGEIVPEFLASTGTISEFLAELNEKSDDYLGFNLLLGSAERAFHYSNRSKKVTLLSDGIHGVSNALLNTPWFKVQRGKLGLSKLLSSANPDSGPDVGPDCADYFDLLADQTEAPAAEVQVTGLNFDYERERSPLFVRAGDYGTRSSTVVIFHNNGRVEFVERTYDLDVRSYNTTRHEFKVEN